MLDLNQRPPPCKGGVIVSRPFASVQKYLQKSIFSFLSHRLCSPSLAWVVVRLSSERAFASLFSAALLRAATAATANLLVSARAEYWTITHLAELHGPGIVHEKPKLKPDRTIKVRNASDQRRTIHL